MIKKSLRAYITRRQQKLFVLPDSEVVRVFLFQPFKHEVHWALKLRVVLAGFTGIYHFQQGGEVHFFCRGLVPDVADKRGVEQPFRLHQNLLLIFPSPLVLAIRVFTSFSTSFSEWMSGKRPALLPAPPLRTVRDSFPSYGSSLS